MLNELDVLARSLSQRNVQTIDWHPNLQKLRKGPALAIALDAMGKAVRVERLSKEQVAELRVVAMPGNQEMFPAFNLKGALLARPPDAEKTAEAFWRLLSGEERMGWAQEERHSKLFRKVIRFATKLEGTFLGRTSMDETLALIGRLRGREGNEIGLLSEVVAAAVGSVKQGFLERDPAIELLLGKPSGDPEKTQLTLIFDVADATHFGRRVASVSAARAWSQALTDAGGRAPEAQVVCSLTGEVREGTGKTLPEVTLPGLGKTYLMSMNSDIPCQCRYGRSGSEVFPIGKTRASELRGAIEYVTHQERAGRTYQLIPNESRKEADLLIAYLEDEPDGELPVVDLFADALTPEGEAAQYEERTRKLLEALQARKAAGKDAAVNVFVLSKIDPGRKQVLFTRHYVADQIRDGCSDWCRGAYNVPRVRLECKRSGVEGEEGPKVPSPLQFMAAFKTKWIKGGAQNCSVPGVSAGTVYRLLLEPGGAGIADALLARHLEQTGALYAGFGAARQGRAWGKDVRKAAPEGVRTGVAVMGILLHKLGRRKEEYMRSREFNFGQLLQLADRLHKLYCEKVRKGAVPPQLVGNSAIAAAMQSPQRALTTIGGRIRPYLAWADTYGGEDAGLAKWLRRQIAVVSSRIAEGDLGAKVTEEGRAEMFLGYLAELKSEKE